MYLRVFKEDFIDGVIKGTSILAHKTGAAYLRTVWIKAEEDKVKIMSTDGNLEFTGQYDANIMESGLVGVEGKKINDLVRKLKPGEIIFRADLNNHVCFIEQDKRKYKLATTESSWFPELSPFPQGNSVLWSGEVFKEIIEKLLFTISDENSLGTMTCMKISRSSEADNEIEMCGFDMQNMGLFTIRDEDMYHLIPEMGMLVAKHYMSELRKWLSPGEIELSIDSDRFFIRKQDLSESISMPISFEEFTDYKAILSTFAGKPRSDIIINRRELMDALERTMIFSTEMNKSAIFELKENEVRINSTAVETGEAKEVLQCRYQGTLDQCVFNIKGLLDILARYISEDVIMSLHGTVRPCKITGVDDPDFFVITMPVEIKEETYYTEEVE